MGVDKRRCNSSYYQAESYVGENEETATDVEFEQYLRELDSTAKEQENDKDFRPTHIEIDDSTLHELFKDN